MRPGFFALLLGVGTLCSTSVMAIGIGSRAAAMLDRSILERPVTSTPVLPATATPPWESGAMVPAGDGDGDVSSAQATPAPSGSAASPRADSAATPLLTAPLSTAAAVVDAPDKAGALFDLMNAARMKDGLPPLVRDDALAAVGRVRAESLVSEGYFDHYSPSGASAFSELAARGVRYRLAGENLARNTFPEGRTAGAALEALMASPTHRANILEPRFARAGVSAVRSGRLWLYVTVFTD